MATVTFCEHTYEDSGDAQGEHRKYHVEFTDAEATSIDARAAVTSKYGIAEGSYLTGTLWRAKLKAERIPDAPTQWKVTVDFGAESLNESKPAGTGVRWNVSVTAAPQSYTRPVYQDSLGAAIVNAAGYPFQQQPTITDYDTRWTISFNTDNGAIIEDIRNSKGLLNSDAVTFTYKGVTLNFDAKTLRLTDYSWGFDHNYASDSTDEVFKVTLTLDERIDGWVDLQLENSGFYDASGKRITEKDINPASTTDDPVVEAVLLDVAGYPLTDGSTATPLEFTVKDPVVFAPLVAGL